MNLYTCTRLCLYLYVGVFRWRNPHLEQITFCHYPLIYIYIYTFEPVYSYTFVSILVYGVFRWRNPLLEQITFCCYPYLFTYIHTDIHTYRLEPICIYTFMSILVYVGILVAKPPLRTNHILSLSINIYIYVYIIAYIIYTLIHERYLIPCRTTYIEYRSPVGIFINFLRHTT